MAKNTTLTVAAAQMICQDGNIDANLAHAESFVRRAAAQGAHLLIFPEFMSPGYRLTPQLWDAGESFDGPTVRWLKETAVRNRIYVGASFLESDGCDFLNTFALSAPNGQIAGAVRKRYPSLWEAYFFKGCDCVNTIDTDIGRLGVGICFDNHTAAVAEAIYESNVDLMLMPHSYCTPTQVSRTVSAQDIERLNSLPGRVARQYNELFGIPVVMVNKSGPWDSPVPPTIFGQPWGYTFSGRSVIIAADGSVQAQLGAEEGLAVGEVTLAPALKRHTRPVRYGRYIYPGPLGRELFRLVEAAGRLSYQLSAQRRRKAAECVAPRARIG
jgi:N-carbamoylputrescine amidase